MTASHSPSSVGVENDMIRAGSGSGMKQVSLQHNSYQWVTGT
ncbi:hypothetical protein RE6C_00647 [Rhodopirellula europaea 6C]|uniref:Uncharacterized protein n=1 Tax=Rhodopirellula europaea 6C TaxID=1263867 RepID=M2BAF6_9BACT|nr:hypothetical protein RE6C_00647 [Rhodopirellula europaea 6C]